ncbi:MAG: magnesium transporter CorA family protein [Chromatiales bacterium]|nr:magnesium transporter CorA family protein [Chromatiales bacterium]
MFSMLFDQSGAVVARAPDTSLLSQRGNGNWVWLDLDGADRAAEQALLVATLGFDALGVADALRARHPPKFESFEDHFLLLLKEFSDDLSELDEPPVVQTAIFVAADLVVSRHPAPSPGVQSTLARIEAGERIQGNVAMAYRLARELLDDIEPRLLAVEERLDRIEAQILTAGDDELLAETVALHTALRRVSRIFGYYPHVFGQLLGALPGHAGEASEHEVRDLIDHSERYASLSRLYLETAGDLINGYISISGHRLNQIMRVLTISTVVFLPLGLLTGIFGMNFAYIPGLEWRGAYFMLLGSMALITIGLLWFFRRRKWL